MEAGPLGELRRTLSDASFAAWPIPALGIFLMEMERRKGSPLTEDEVLANAEIAPAIVMKSEHRDQMMELRGFGQLDPDNVWEEWLEFREIMEREAPANDD